MTEHVLDADDLEVSFEQGFEEGSIRARAAAIRELYQWHSQKYNEAVAGAEIDAQHRPPRT